MERLREIIQANPALYQSSIQQYDPIDALYSINPELATLAYANQSKWLTPELLPYLAHFRELQSNEKISLLQAIVDKFAIDADERKTQTNANAVRDITIKIQDSETEREKIRAQGALDAQKLKYELRRQIITDQTATQKYISDNQCRALTLEAEAIRDAMIETTHIKADAQNKKTDADLITRLKSMEVKYLVKMKEAQVAQYGIQQQTATRIIEAYLQTQAQLMRFAMISQMNQAEQKQQTQQAEYSTISNITKYAADVLKTRDAKTVRVTGETNNAKINLRINVD